MQEITFSVAVITYNQEEYISQTLDSILNQQHDYKYEIVIGEDCSTDNTKKIIEEYVEKYPNIIKPLYNNPNKGLINNYFNIINHCQGKYIMECAGDDYWLPGKVETQIGFMENNPDVGMCYGKVKVWNEEKQIIERKYFGSDRKSFEFLLKNGNDIPALTVCLKNELVQKYISEIVPQEKKWLMEDYPMWLWFSHESKIQFIDDVLAVYRVLENSLSHSDDMEKSIRFNLNIEVVRKFFSEYFVTNIDIKNQDEIVFYVYVNLLKKHYTKAVAQQLRQIYKKNGKKTMKFFLYSLLSYSSILWKLVMNKEY